ncbi:glycosyltransferase domain-containing protein [Algoriphagus antarcticus]|uniref:Uncharacterized protein DUF616 n=1 Tax=Algoriphagus antarcticus TaxID=238540 RepID=A0A3E0DZR2_9BACT|nr:glycosyltransferase domain-containing protein [Algoriphagus antarcticus]REG91488.1 uncharacterized protein DUF616 [Algoriphagus antarcticus]
MNRWVIYTALFGDYDDLVRPVQKFEGFDFVCFTDQQNLRSDLWEIKIIECTEKSPVLMNRRIKMMPHQYLPDHKVSVYIDSNLKLLKDLSGLLENELSERNFLVPKHSIRNCLYEEAKECIIFQKSDYSATIKQLNHYRSSGFPAQFGLSENGILIRKHNDPEIKSLMEQWWKEFQTGSGRDQLSLPFVFWKNHLKLPLIGINSRDQVYFSNQPHRKEELGTIAKLMLSIKIRLRRLIYSFYSFQ